MGKSNCFLVQYHTLCFHLGIDLIVVPSPYHINIADKVSIKILIGPRHWIIILLHEVKMLSYAMNMGDKTYTHKEANDEGLLSCSIKSFQC